MHGIFNSYLHPKDQFLCFQAQVVCIRAACAHRHISILKAITAFIEPLELTVPRPSIPQNSLFLVDLRSHGYNPIHTYRNLLSLPRWHKSHQNTHARRL